MSTALFPVFETKSNEMPRILSDEDLMAQVDQDRDAFIQLYERYCGPLFRYFSIQTNGDTQLASELTVQTFHVMLWQHKSFEMESFPGWLFGLAWDVLNSCKHQKYLQEPVTKPVYFTTYKGNGAYLDRAEASRMLEILRSLPFYQRETLYLRFFAGLAPKDVSILMDKEESDVKLLVYQGVNAFASQYRHHAPVIFSQDVQSILAEAYDLHLSMFLAGGNSGINLPPDDGDATKCLEDLRNAFSLGRGLRADILRRLEALMYSNILSGRRL